MILKQITSDDLKPCSQYLIYLRNYSLCKGWTDSQSNLFYSGKPILDGDIIEIYDLNDLKESILWRVKLTWTHKRQTGKQDVIVQASDAVEALRKAWTCEDDKDIRTVNIEWLTPTECIIT